MATEGKNIVVCLDGTGNTVKASRNTNVLRAFDLLDFSDGDRQVAYYDPGVGTFSALGAWTPIGRRVTRLAGLAFGTGLRHNLGEAYLFLVRTWQPGDRLFFFGFSRGAHAVRALAGLVDTIGMLHPHEENLVPYAISAYARNWDRRAPAAGTSGTQQEDLREKFRESFARRRGTAEPHPVPVEYLGLWDTVEASGHLVPGRGQLGWPGVRTLPNVAAVRHAMAIDERRWPYRVVRLEAPPPAPSPRVREEVWFPGVHSDVGGTFAGPDGAVEPVPRLSDITLKWVVDGARQRGLAVDPAAYAHECSLGPQHAAAGRHWNGWAWRAFEWRARNWQDGPVHASAQPRFASANGYADPDWQQLVAD